MKIFIDFDDVIFNTKQFKEDLAEVFFNHGISKELYEKMYYDPRDKSAIRTYDPLAQINRLKKITEINEKKILSDIELFLQNSSKYVFEDVKEFTANFDCRDLFIISYGDISFQNKKIEISRVKEYIPNVLVTDKLKAQMLAEFLNVQQLPEDEEIFFLDDRIEQIRDVKEKFPRIVTILVKRPEGRYSEMKKEDCCNFEAHNLDEVELIINSFKLKS